ncbi:hypothetical protein AB0H17_00590 [Streptomyces olivoreticuli]
MLLVPDDDVLALRGIMADVLATPEANRRIAGMISGLDIRHPMPDAPRPPPPRHPPLRAPAVRPWPPPDPGLTGALARWFGPAK